MVAFQNHVHSSFTFESDLRLLKSLLQSTAHRYLAVCVFVALTAPVVFSAAHFMSRRRRDALIKLASQLEYDRCNFSNEKHHGSESSKEGEADNTPLFTQVDGKGNTSTHKKGCIDCREEESQGLALFSGTTFHSIKRAFSASSEIAQHKRVSGLGESTIFKNYTCQGRSEHNELTTPPRHTLRSTAMMGANRGGGGQVSNYRGSLRGDFFSHCAFASVSVSYPPTPLSIRGRSPRLRPDGQGEGVLSPLHAYRYRRRRRLLSRVWEEYSQALAPLARVILAKQRASDEDFAYSVASTASAWFLRRAARSLGGMAARDATLHTVVFGMSRTVGAWVPFYNTGCDGAGAGPLRGVWGLVRALAASLLWGSIFDSPSSVVLLKSSPRGLLTSSSCALAMDSLLDLYVFVMSADSPTVRCCLPLWLTPLWRLLLLAEWIGRPAAAPWVRSRNIIGTNGRGIAASLVADSVWKELTPKGYFVCILLWSLPEVITHSFLDIDWWSLSVRLRQLLCSEEKYKKVQTCISKIHFWKSVFPSGDKNIPKHQADPVDMNHFMNPGKWSQKFVLFYKLLGVASRRLLRDAWSTGRYICTAFPALTRALGDASFCFIVLFLLPIQIIEANTGAAWSCEPGLHFYALGCLRGIIIACRWARSAKTE